MKALMILIVMFPLSIFAQADQNAAETSNSDTHLMGSGSKAVDGLGVNKDTEKYKNMKKDKKALQKQEAGNNPTSTDTIQGKNSKKIE